MVKFFKKLFSVDGSSLINKSIGLFDKIIARLEKGIALCDKEVSGNQSTIVELKAKNEDLQNIVLKASKTIDNLKKIYQ
jgi:hypothetical protein